jgi:hypothetical protein
MRVADQQQHFLFRSNWGSSLLSMDSENRDSSIIAHLWEMGRNPSWSSAFSISIGSRKEGTNLV